MMTAVYIVVVGLVGLVIGGAAGYLVRRNLASTKMANAEREAEKLLKDARREAENTLKEARLEVMRSELERRAQEVLVQDELAPRRWAERSRRPTPTARCRSP